MSKNIIILISVLVTLYMGISALVALVHFNPIGFIIDLALAALAAYTGWTHYKKQ